MGPVLPCAQVIEPVCQEIVEVTPVPIITQTVIEGGPPQLVSTTTKTTTISQPAPIVEMVPVVHEQDPVVNTFVTHEECAPIQPAPIVIETIVEDPCVPVVECAPVVEDCAPVVEDCAPVVEDCAPVVEDACEPVAKHCEDLLEKFEVEDDSSIEIVN